MACSESIHLLCLQTKLFTLSEVPIFEIFTDSNGSEGVITDHMRSVMDDLVRNIFYLRYHLSRQGIDTSWLRLQGLPVHIVGTSSIFTGEEEIFAFARACSRLVQMGSKEWAETAGDA